MSQKKIAVIGIPGKWSTEVLADAIEEKTGFRLVLDMQQVSADLAAKKLWAHDVDLCEMDGIIVKKISQQYSPHTLDRIELLRLAESQGVRVFTSPEKIVRMIDRLACTMTLSNAGIPMPPTIITESIADAFDAVTKFGAAVFKPLYSTKAQGMTLIEADWPDIQIRNQIEAFYKENPMMYIQKKLDISGKDYGMVFMQELFDMDFTTVDVADTPDGPIVFEVSAFGGFRGAKEGLGIDAADLYANYVLAELDA